jgi:hypothetical protein
MSTQVSEQDRGIIAALIADGRPPLLFTGVALVLCGFFAFFLSASGQFLPHDIHFLGMTADQLCAVKNCRVVHFMFHDRVAFGGALIAIGSLYMWLVEFPLRAREPWAWWALVASGISGFGSFLAYLGYGYLDTWHGVATMLLLPLFVLGLIKSRSTLDPPAGIASLTEPGVRVSWTSGYGIGRALLLATAVGMVLGGATVMTFGMTRVFVPQDLTYMGLARTDLQAISPRLIPLIAHDRAGFGGAICTAGITVLFCVWCARPSRSLFQILLVTGVVGFGAAIGVHPVVGYNDIFHLAPAIAGAIMFVIGMALCWKPMMTGRATNEK